MEKDHDLNNGPEYEDDLLEEFNPGDKPSIWVYIGLWGAIGMAAIYLYLQT